MDSEQNRIGLSSIAFDWFDNRTHSKTDVLFCSITEPNRTIGHGVQLSSIEFWFDFVRLDTPGICYLRPMAIFNETEHFFNEKTTSICEKLPLESRYTGDSGLWINFS